MKAARETTFLLILIAASTVLIPLLNQNRIVIAQQQNNQTSPSLTNQQVPTGISFQIDNTTFYHHMAVVNNGVQIHYVIGGHGNPVVLLHGWPETWYEWRHVMPTLAKNFTIIAPDLPGLGDSSKPSTGYDGKTVAEDIHQLVDKLGFKTIFLVGHDIGAQIAYSYAAAHPTEVKRLVVSDKLFPGFAPSGITEPWWFVFHQTPDIPESLVQGKELMYLSWFYHNLAYNPAAITQDDINEFVSHYSAPGGMRAGFEYYRAFPQDAIENQNYSKTKLIMPVLAVFGSYYPALGGNITGNPALYSMKALAQNVRGIQIPNSGHWGPEERPDFVIKMLDNFFGGNTSATSK
jgi:pimeloyl-ACP methyl ester carboxylesterase